MSALQRWRAATVILVIGTLLPIYAIASDLAGSGRKVRVDLNAGSKTIVLIGASYAGGWPSDTLVAGYRMINKGVSGQQSFEMLARFENDVLALKPDAVIIWGFINDVFRSDRAQIDQTLRRTRESILAMVERARKSGITPILATEVTIRGKDGWSEAFQAVIGSILGKSSYQDYVNEHVIETNRWIRELATGEKLLLLDLESVLTDQQGVRRKELSQPDGSHISPKGYQALTRYVDERLKVLSGP